MVEVRVLGALEARVAGAPALLPRDARARELLAWLAVHPGPHPRSLLAGRLRPDVAEDSARKTLRDAVYRLRAALGPAGDAALAATREHVELVDVRVDLHEFRRLRDAGELEAAVTLSGGELLAGLDADWVLRARDEHAAELADMLGALAERAEARDDLRAAVAWTRRRLEVEPLTEAAHRELIRLLALADDRPAALVAARTLAERLRRELGVPPSAATRGLVDDVRRGRFVAAGSRDDPRTAPDAPSSLPAPLARTARPEGRPWAHARIDNAWADAASGALRLALVAGEPGIGKTTLAGELARRAHAQGASVLYGRSDEEALVPFEPWVEALERCLSDLDEAGVEHWLTVHGGALARLLPARGGSRAPATGERDRFLAFETVRALLEHRAAERPLLLVLDDLHWADRDSLALLRHLARTSLRARLLIVLCARELELSPATAETLGYLRRHGPMVEVTLSGLDEDEVAALLAARTGASDRESAQRLRERTGGNPLFLDALLRDEQERGEEAVGPPPGVRDVLARRVSRLSADTRSAVTLAAVVGLEFDLDFLAAVDGRDLDELLEALDGATETGLVAPAGSPGRYAFAHALVPETILAALPASRRARLHLQVADGLAERREARAGVPAGEVARHLRAGAPLAGAERLARWELIAAREASAGLAHQEAAAHYEAALAAQPQSPDRAQLLLALGHARERAGRRPEARAAFAEAAALALATQDSALLADAALGHGGLAVVISAPDPRTTALLEDALASIPAGERARRARLRARLAVELFYADPERARELSERALADARASRDGAALVGALNARRVALWDPAHVDERLAAVDEMVHAAETSGDREAALQARNWRVADLWELGRIPEVAAEIDAYEALAEQLVLPHYRWYVPLWRAGLALLAGRWEEAGALSERALALGEQADDPNATLLVHVQHEFALDVQRRFDGIDRDWISATAADSSEPAPWVAWLAQIDAAAGRHADARAAIAQLTANGLAALPMRANWLAACELADAAADVGDRDTAAALRPRLEPHAEQYAVIARGVGCCNVTEHYLGRLAATLSDLEEAETRLRRAVAANERTGAQAYAATTLTRLGEVLAARGAHDQARDTLTQAMTRAETLHMPAQAGEAATALAQLDG